MVFNEDYFKNKTKITQLIGMSRNGIIAHLGQRCNDIHERIWVYKRDNLKSFWQKKYMIIIFDDNNVAIDVKLRMRIKNILIKTL
jgi:hypothetical protein